MDSTTQKQILSYVKYISLVCNDHRGLWEKAVQLAGLSGHFPNFGFPEPRSHLECAVSEYEFHIKQQCALFSSPRCFFQHAEKATYNNLVKTRSKNEKK